MTSGLRVANSDSCDNAPGARPDAPGGSARRRRAKAARQGEDEGARVLLDDDALSAAVPLPGLSDRARRCLFERLVALAAARELAGRPTFRLNGL